LGRELALRLRPYLVGIPVSGSSLLDQIFVSKFITYVLTDEKPLNIFVCW